MSVFQYDSLEETDTPRTRLILPGNGASETEADYFIHSVDLRFSDYIALSYTWGAPTPTQSIPITKRHHQPAEHQVGQNLFDFLQAYRTHAWGMSQSPGLRLWIDQISIDQSNLAERNAQVSIMNQIYRNAAKVLVWLGCEPDMVEAVRRLRDNKVDDQTLAKLLRHPYFSRLWIVQEVSLSTNIYVVCGEVELEWKVLTGAVAQLKHKNIHSTLYPASNVNSAASHLSYLRHPPSVIPATAIAIIRKSQYSRTLEQCIADFCRNASQDPRDKVYALLGLTSERWRVCVDYKKAVVEVYIDAVRALFEELFDRLDPQCFYSKQIERNSGSHTYINTTLVLAEAMGLPPHQVKGLQPFLERVLDIYLDTPLRNIQYHHGSHPPPTVAVQDSSSLRRILRSKKFSKQNNNATRRNPLVQDVIPAMGLRVAQSTANTNTQGRSQKPVVDGWWYEYKGKVDHYYCPTEGEVSHSDQQTHKLCLAAAAELMPDSQGAAVEGVEVLNNLISTTIDKSQSSSLRRSIERNMRGH